MRKQSWGTKTCRNVGLSVAAVWRSVEFGEGEELDAAEGELPAAHVLLDVVHPAAVPAHTQNQISSEERLCSDTHAHTQLL